jgi:ubiquitin C-terminal hydrolase
MLKGLHNLGNTCYLNTVLQCLFHLEEFTSIIEDEIFPDECLIEKYYDLYKSLTNEETNVIYNLRKRRIVENNDTEKIINFLKTFSTIYPKFLGHSQQDSHEALMLILDRFQSEFKNNLFGGTMISIIEDINSNFKSITNETFTCLTLEIPQKSNITLKDCFDAYFSPEVLTNENRYQREDTKELIDIRKQFALKYLNKNLIIHLKRFIYTSTCRRKNDVLIDFPLENLSLGEYFCKSDFSHTYNLVAVANHTGTLTSGHYYAYCKEGNSWVLYNDSSVAPISSSQIVTPTSYILFYVIK